MQPEAAFVALLVAHLLGDFVLQTRAMVEAKTASRPGPYLRHGLVHFAVSVAVLALVFPPARVATAAVLGVVGVLVVAHLAIDVGKAALIGRVGWRDGAGLFLLDQGFHVLTLVGAAWALSGPAAPAAALEQWLGLPAMAALRLAAVYLAVVFAGGYLIRHLLDPLRKAVRPAPGEEAAQLERAGLWIGWLERFVVMTALLAGWPATAGLVVAAKSILRFPALKDRPFAEYFVVGTLLSVALAIGGAVLLHRVL